MEELMKDLTNLEYTYDEMDNCPLVSICLLTYQHAKYIEDSIRSVLRQTYSNIELLVLDDASPDNTVELITQLEKELEAKNIKFIFIKHSINTGNEPMNVNELIKRAHGKYIKLMSGDDILLDDCIASLVEFIEQKKCSVVYSNAYFINDDYKYGERFKREKCLKNHHEVPMESMFDRLLKANFVQSTTVLLRRDLYDKYGMNDETLGYSDYDMWLRLAGKEPFGYLDKALLLYRKSETGLSNFSTKSKFLLNYNTTVKILNKHLKRKTPFEREDYIIAFYKEWADKAKSAHYYSIFLMIEFRMLLRTARYKKQKMD